MIRGIYIFMIMLLLVGCGGREKRVSSNVISDTSNLFFSGVIDVNKRTFTDCSTAKTYLYDIGVQNSRDIHSSINNTSLTNTKELYCKIKGHIVYDHDKDASVLIIENVLSLSRLDGCGKPILPGVYKSSNTYKNSYVCVLNDDYTYTIALDGEEVESGTWGKVYEYEGLMMWSNTTEDVKNTRLFTIEYLINSIMFTLYYDNHYLIFS